MKTANFEQTYPKMPFAELIRLGIFAARAWARYRDGHGAAGHGQAQASA